jgi:hypothetical protein
MVADTTGVVGNTDDVLASGPAEGDLGRQGPRAVIGVVGRPRSRATGLTWQAVDPGFLAPFRHGRLVIAIKSDEAARRESKHDLPPGP